ncbi:MAG: hypothetical protein AABX52_01710 [Nanoarchaeota archaeon]
MNQSHISLLITIALLVLLSCKSVQPTISEHDELNTCLIKTTDTAIQTVIKNKNTGIETAIAAEIEQNILTCKFDIISKDTPHAKVTINNESVNVSLDYPLVIQTSYGQKTYDHIEINRPARISEQILTTQTAVESYTKDGEIDITDAIHRKLDIKIV